MSKTTPYKKPIDQILKTLGLALTDPIKSARSFSVLGDIPPTTGYRVVQAMESRDFLARDSAGYFTRGSESLRIALRAWGVGALYPACEPVLNQLTEEARLTAFLGIRANNKLHVGPTAIGSGVGQALPSLNAIFNCEIAENAGDVIEADMYIDKEYTYQSGVIKNALCAVVCDGISQSQAVIGVLLTDKPVRKRESIIADVNTAKRRLQECLALTDC